MSTRTLIKLSAANKNISFLSTDGEKIDKIRDYQRTYDIGGCNNIIINTNLNSSAKNTEVPSSKCVYELIKELQDRVAALESK